MHLLQFHSLSLFASATFALSLDAGVSYGAGSSTSKYAPEITEYPASSVVTTTYPDASPTETASSCAYWLEDMTRQGIAAFNPNPGEYQVFRNVKDFGAKGNGKTDDTRAIQKAISSGGRCAPGVCASSTTTNAVVYIPSGTYLVSDSIVDYYSSMIIGNPNCMPVIKASSNFTSRFVIDGNQYQSDGTLGWKPVNVFWRQMKNLVVDTTDASPSLLLTGIHWASSQATSLQNIVFKMSTEPGTQHEGIFIPEGSGGFVTDLVFHGGNYGLDVGNQQFTMRNLSFHGAVTAINQLWDWGWTYKGISIHNCKTGINMTSLDEEGAQTVGSVTLFDSEIKDTPVGILMSRNATSTPGAGGSLILENVALQNVPVAVMGPKNKTVLAGSSGKSLIAAWGQGHVYNGDSDGKLLVQYTIAAYGRPTSLTAGSHFYERSKPQYEDVPASGFVSIRDAGAKGDGKTDDTVAINLALLAAAATGKIVYFDSGYYRVTRTIYIPAGSKIVGEALPVILSSGDYFANMDFPKAVVQVGLPGEIGDIEWSDMVISTQGAQAGAVLIEYNLASPFGKPGGMWEVHTRIGGFAGSQLQVPECLKTPNTTVTSENLNEQCIAAFMSMHVTKWASGLYMENCWLWVADHDVEDAENTQISLYAGRGLLVESIAGGIWMYGTGVEHQVLYEYYLRGTKDVVMGQIQTETAYYQPNPGAEIPFPPVEALGDPMFAEGASGWGVHAVDSKDVLVYGAGLYSFFINNSDACAQQNSTVDCQADIFSVEDSEVVVYNLNTVGTTHMITVDRKPIAEAVDNLNGFVDTIAWFSN